MNSAAARLAQRIFFAQFLVGAALLAILTAFVPELLLLGDVVARAAISSALTATPLLTIAGFLFTRARLARHQYLLRALAVGSTAVEPEELASLSRLPAYVTVVFVALVEAAIVASMLTPLRPALLDWDTAVRLTLVGTVIVATAALPLYVLARAAVARVLEIVQPDAMSGVLARAEETGAARRAILRRVLAAIVTPVGFVAVGAALVANAHVRKLDEQGRERTAEAIARIAIETAPGTAAVGRAEAIAAAEENGFSARIDHEIKPFSIERGDEGRVSLTTPLEDGAATIRFQVTSVSPLSSSDMTIAALAVFIAIVLGLRFGGSLADDIAFATQAVRILGTEDLVRGSNSPKPPARYAQVASLNRAINTLAGRFSVFANAQEKAIAARESARRTRSLLFASVSHDLRSPLNAILGFTQLVSQTSLNHAQEESLDLIQQSGRELLALIEIILDVARIEAGRMVLGRADLHPAALLAQAARRIHYLHADRPLQVAIDFEDDLPEIRADGLRTVQALAALAGVTLRLLDMPGAPERVPRTVSLRAIHRSDSSIPGVQIEVEGPDRALSPGELSRLLTPQPAASGHRPHGGLTLAVTLARSLIELHGGTLDVVVSPRGSALFTVKLPALSKAQDHA